MGDPSKVHARGPGLEATGNVANKPTYFDIYTAGKKEAIQSPHMGCTQTHIDIHTDMQERR